MKKNGLIVVINIAILTFSGSSPTMVGESAGQVVVLPTMVRESLTHVGKSRTMVADSPAIPRIMPTISRNLPAMVGKLATQVGNLPEMVGMMLCISSIVLLFIFGIVL